MLKRFNHLFSKQLPESDSEFSQVVQKLKQLENYFNENSKKNILFKPEYEATKMIVEVVKRTCFL